MNNQDKGWIEPVLAYINVLQNMSPFVQGMFLIVVTAILIVGMYLWFKLKHSKMTILSNNDSSALEVIKNLLIEESRRGDELGVIINNLAYTNQEFATQLADIARSSRETTQALNEMKHTLAEIKQTLEEKTICPYGGKRIVKHPSYKVSKDATS